MRHTMYSPALLQALRENLKHIYEVKTTPASSENEHGEASGRETEHIAETQIQNTHAGEKRLFKS